jgi:hypothetical protein
MLWKSLLTGTLLAAIAGAIVYFGSGGDLSPAGVKSDLRDATAGTKEATNTVTHKIGEVTSETIKIMADASSSLGSAVKKQMPSESSETSKSNSEDSDKTKKKWLDRYLKHESNAPQTQAAGPVDVEKPVNAPIDGVENGRLKTEKASIQTFTSEQEIKAVYDTALAETKVIKIIELRDRAYLSLIDYTTRMNDFERSKSIISEISQPELRDTARSNIAVGLARAGQREAAFALLENIETKPLSDILRLQVIEAMTTPRPEESTVVSRTN